MITVVLQIFFIAFLFAQWKGANRCYKLLILMQAISFFLAPVVGLTIKFDSLRTIFNTSFCLVNLFLIIEPWRKARFTSIEVENEDFFKYYKKALYVVLDFTIVVNLIVLVIILTHMRSIATFKAQQGYHLLYTNVPYFGLMFRYTEVTKNFGLLAFPICIYYLRNNSKRRAKQAFLRSTSTLIAAIANYSRAQILTYVLLCICLFFYSNCTFEEKIKRIIKRIIKYFFVASTIVMIIITGSRFNSSTMSYYSERIPANSLVKSSALYSTFAYASMGFRNGIEQMELHEIEDVMYGEPVFYQLLQTLSYFNIISWDAENYAQRFHEVYDKEGLTVGVNEINSESVFHGYTCSMVKMFGYVGTLILSLLFYRYVKRNSMGSYISVKSLSVLAFFLIISINSIFYSECSAWVFPFLFYLLILVSYSLLRGQLRIRIKCVV